MQSKRELTESHETKKVKAEPGVTVDAKVEIVPKIELETANVIEFLEAEYIYRSPRQTIVSAVVTVKTENMALLKISEKPDRIDKLGSETRLYFTKLNNKRQWRLYRAVLKTGRNDSSGVACIRFTC